MWPSPARPHINCGLPPEFFFVAPASSFHHHPEAVTAASTINFDPHSLNASSAIGVIPLLTAAPCMASDEDLFNRRGGGGSGSGSGMQLWQHHQQGQNSPAYLIKPMTVEHPNLLQSGGGGGGGASSSAAGTTTCQDCGNQAKKDCPHRRCRTCCKSRGYDCTTHLKSTWVPAARRRERQLLATSGATAGSSQSTSGTKKPRLGGASQTTTASHTSTSNTTQARSFDTTSSHQGFKESLPGQVRAPAVFKCVRVTAVDDGEDQYAYQAVVKIGGHVFKGFLYDQGVEGRDGLPNLAELHLGGGRNGASSSPPPPVLDHASDIYGGTSGGGFLGGSTNYGNPIN
ncbi:protein LATERAL ROOT PRIMORDIUM 1-like isoform X2 [Salvia miltiorrhiza]|uniref:protein LATERAL ROOT PRIMORDIUM 1-like isoform X2 n=1 Tax=Salvia miltiorrhiza TaxID=226208 RepID=UPI0025AC0E14|nr:protein LATERAL ROOT PRIMORDIUM 1-like isoform X2 [Salvia miltiorrhiza]XP_057801247.1 protein LATERAL ROOT PRIMORDIUM 1-like isoform X2 [Salvia miltiorrhiza]XP_057801254.1 protein LATERAL ROOT PRIMORDIUM 1-like isoform X2 [Salvia miltiorrhiza]